MIVNLDQLKKLSGDPGKSMMMLGKAAEHIVCAHLIMSGYTAYLSEQALPYDVVVDAGDRLLRVQVKGSAFPINVNPAGAVPNYRYLFDLRKCGKGGSRVRWEFEFDIAAMVALDTCEIAYLPFAAIGSKRMFSVTNRPDGTILSRGRRFEDYSISKTLAAIKAGKIDPLESQRGRMVDFAGESHTIVEWARITGIPHNCLSKRFAVGWSAERALSTPHDLGRVRKMTRIASKEEIARRAETHRQWWATKRKDLIQAVQTEASEEIDLDQRRQPCTGAPRDSR
jgi:hypothetical protein